MKSDSILRTAYVLSLLLWYLNTTERAFSADFGDIELSGYALGSRPRDPGLYNQGAVVPASIQQGFGAGLKIGLFPSALRRMLGIEIDSNIHGSALSFTHTPQRVPPETGHSDLLITNTTFNLVLRYPGELVRPYVGVGVGWSIATLLNPNVAGREDRDFESAYALVHQFLGGTQVLLSPKLLLFVEYRYRSSNYHWESLAMGFRTHYGLLGIGLRF